MAISIDEAKWTWKMMLDPGKVTRKRMSIGDALGFYYKLALLPLIVSLIFGIVFGIAASAILSPFLGIFVFLGALGVTVVAVAVIAVLLLIIIPISIFISAAIWHFFGKYVFRQFRSDYTATFTALVYGQAPQILFFWLAIIPFINVLYFVVSIWGLIVEIFALSNQQKTSKLSVIGVLVGIIVVVFVVSLVVALLVGLALY